MRKHLPLWLALLALSACGISVNSSTNTPPTSCSNGLPANTARCNGNTLESCVINGNAVSQSSSVCLGNTPSCVTKTADAGTFGACCPVGVADAEASSCRR